MCRRRSVDTRACPVRCARGRRRHGGLGYPRAGAPPESAPGGAGRSSEYPSRGPREPMAGEADAQAQPKVLDLGGATEADVPCGASCPGRRAGGAARPRAATRSEGRSAAAARLARRCVGASSSKVSSASTHPSTSPTSTAMPPPPATISSPSVSPRVVTMGRPAQRQSRNRVRKANRVSMSSKCAETATSASRRYRPRSA